MQASANRFHWGLAVGLVMVAGSVAALRACNRSARESLRFRQRWEGVSRTAHDLVWELAPDGTITFMNDAAVRLFGVSAAELLGHNVFALVHPDDVEGARAILDRCLGAKTGWNNVRLRALRCDGTHHWVETSGVARFDQHGELVGFTATTHELGDAAATLATTKVIQEAVAATLETESFTTVLQPIFSLTTGEVVGAEALTRFTTKPTRTPDRWFADAHEVGLGIDLEVAVLGAALRVAIERLPDGVYLSLKVSPATLVSPQLSSVLAATAFPVRHIVLELTEHVSITDYGALRAPLTRLASMGVRLAVDDAGAGFASFRHILRTRPDFIKLDQTLTRGIDADAAQRAFAAAVVMFAMEVGATVVAEGVETAEELDVLVSLSIDAAQGYLLGRPAPDPTSWPVRHPAIQLSTTTSPAVISR